MLMWFHYFKKQSSEAGKNILLVVRTPNNTMFTVQETQDGKEFNEEKSLPSIISYCLSTTAQNNSKHWNRNMSINREGGWYIKTDVLTGKDQILATCLSRAMPLAKTVAFPLLWSFSVHMIWPAPTLQIVAQEVNICGDLGTVLGT